MIKIKLIYIQYILILFLSHYTCIVYFINLFNIKSINLGYFLLFNTSLFNSYLIIIAFSALILYQNIIIIIQIINIVIYFIYCQLTNFL
jgi:hypothetical protein